MTVNALPTLGECGSWSKADGRFAGKRLDHQPPCALSHPAIAPTTWPSMP